MAASVGPDVFFSSVVSFTQCSTTCGLMPLPALSLWLGRQPYRPRLVGGRRGGGPSSVAPRSRSPPTGRRRDSPISASSDQMCAKHYLDCMSLLTVTILKANAELKEAFAQLGVHWSLLLNLQVKLEEFVCKLYATRPATSIIDALRYNLFCARKGDADSHSYLRVKTASESIPYVPTIKL